MNEPEWIARMKDLVARQASHRERVLQICGRLDELRDEFEALRLRMVSELEQFQATDREIVGFIDAVASDPQDWWKTGGAPDAESC